MQLKHIVAIFITAYFIRLFIYMGIALLTLHQNETFSEAEPCWEANQIYP